MALTIASIAFLGFAEKYSIIEDVKFPERYFLYKSFVCIICAALAYAIAAAYERSRKISEKMFTDLSIKAVQLSKLSTLGEMAGGITHEVNNPVAIICGLVLRMQRKIDDGSMKSDAILNDLAKIEAAANRIAKIVSGLMAFSQTGSNCG